jgi:hypothetical protein
MDDRVGVTVHFLAGGMPIRTSASEFRPSRIMQRGDVLLVDAEVRAANTGIDGRCFFDLDDDQQLARFGKIYFKPGVPDADFDPLEPGTVEWDERREAARRRAHEIPDAAQKMRELAMIREMWGTAPGSKSRTLAEYVRDGDE